MTTMKDPGVGTSRRFPLAAPSYPDAPHVRQASITVDAGHATGALQPIWASLGYDEINWTYTATGAGLLQTMASTSRVPFHVRPHYMFLSGSGFGLPHFGSGNVYHEDAAGVPYFDFTVLDQTYDAIVGAGHHVLVELGFTPKDLVPDRAYEELTLTDSPTVYSAYEAGHWSYPPKDLDKWAKLVAGVATHSLERYGEDEVATWLWELWNEPDIFYWRGTPEEFSELYRVTVDAVRSVLPGAKVGGPAVTGGENGPEFLRGFLASASANRVPLDFVSFHTKGSAFRPWRTYGPLDAGVRPDEQQSPSAAKMLFEIRRLLRVIAEFPEYVDLPAIVDECDAGVPAHWGIYDNPNFVFQNTEYYPAFQVKLMKKILDLNGREQASVEQATTWSFYFEGERYFEGTRSLLTTGGIEKPFLNAYRALGLLGATRLAVTSDAAWDVDELDALERANLPEEVDALASRADDGRVTVLVWRHTDDQYQRDAQPADVELTVRGLGAGLPHTVTEYRIDADHSNAHTIWQQLGSPQRPTDEQLAAIRARQGLEVLARSEATASPDGTLALRTELPLPSVSAFVIEVAR